MKEISSKGSTFLFLCKTQLFTTELRRIAFRLGFDNCFRVDCAISREGDHSGGLGFLWKGDGPVVLSSFSQNHI